MFSNFPGYIHRYQSGVFNTPSACVKLHVHHVSAYCYHIPGAKKSLRPPQVLLWLGHCAFDQNPIEHYASVSTEYFIKTCPLCVEVCSSRRNANGPPGHTNDVQHHSWEHGK